MKSVRRDPIREVRGRVVPLPYDDLDTDQLAPARFVRAPGRRRSEVLLHDWRFDSGRARPDSPLDRPKHRGAEILLAGANFGCGSSRENAVQACLDYGLKAIVALSFAEVRINAARNRLLTVAVGRAIQRQLLAAVAADPALEVTISLEDQTLALPSRTVSFPYDPFDRRCLLAGEDALDYLLAQEEAIGRWEAGRERALPTDSGSRSHILGGRGRPLPPGEVRGEGLAPKPRFLPRPPSPLTPALL